MSGPDRPAHRIALLIADVDGTLVTDHKVLTERAQRAVRALRDAGIRFAITSGRPPRGMAMLIEPLALDLPIAGFNGGVFWKPDGTVISEKTLPPEAARRACAVIRDHGMDVWVYTGTDWLIQDPNAPHVAREQWTVKFPPTIVPDVTVALDKAVKIVGVSDDHDLVARCEAAARQALGTDATAARSQPYYLDVTHRDANKGFVVEWFMDFLSLPAASIATIGDMPNDVLMFEKSGLSIAMGNASPEVQKQADCVTDSYTDEGFAKSVERYILGADSHDPEAVQ